MLNGMQWEVQLLQKYYTQNMLASTHVALQQELKIS